MTVSSPPYTPWVGAHVNGLRSPRRVVLPLFILLAGILIGGAPGPWPFGHGAGQADLDTHLETEAAAQDQAAQAQELLAGALTAPGAVVATGDFSSAADGSTTPTYALLTQTFADAWTSDHAGLAATVYP